MVGAGPNGLAAAIEIARAGRRVLVLEANETVGGAARSASLTLPGFLHDLGSAIHPLAYGSPFFRQLVLEESGLEWVQPPVPLAHPLDGGGAVLLERSVETTAAGLGPDARMYRRIMGPLAASWEEVAPDVLGPLRFPHHPLALARFGLLGLPPATLTARTLFRGVRARALFAGLAAHSFLPLERPPSASFALALGVLGHVCGWPFPRGGAQRIADALAARLRSLGGEIVTGRRIGDLAELPPARAVLLDLTPRQIATIAAARLPSGYLGKLAVTGTVPGCSSWTMRSPARSPGRRQRCGGRGRSTWAGPWRRSRRGSERCGRDGIPRDRSCCWRSRACSTRAGHRQASRPRGRTVMCRTARRRT